MAELDIPESWGTATLAEVSEFIRGITFPASAKKSAGDPNLIACLRTSNIQREVELDDLIYVPKDYVRNERQVVQNKDVLISLANSAELVGKVAQVEGTPHATFGGFLGCIRTALIDSSFMFLFLRSGFIQSKLRASAKKTTNIANLSGGSITGLEIPLPPLGEQKRIVAKIESTQERIKTIEQCVTKADELIGKYREALLQKAFRGELVPQDPNDEPASKLLERIRADRTKQTDGKKKKKDDLPPIKPEEIPFEIPKSWEWVSLGDFSFVTKLAGFEYTEHIQLKDSGEVPVIRAQNVRKGYLDLTNLKFISSTVSQLLHRCAIQKKCLLMTFIGANIGDTAVIDPKVRHHLAPNVAKIEPDAIFNHDYLMRYLLSSDGRSQVFKSMKSTAQPSLSMTTIREVFVPVPPIEEQDRISNRLMMDFDALNSVSDSVSRVHSTIVQLNNSILSFAFSGRLVPQDPSEGTGHEILEKIKTQIAGARETPAKKSKPKKRAKV